MPIQPVRKRAEVRRFRDYSALSSHLSTKGLDGLEAELFSMDGWDRATDLIGIWKWDDTDEQAYLLGDGFLGRAKDTVTTTIDTTASPVNTISVVDASSFAKANKISIWQPSGATEVAFDRVLTNVDVAGDNLTFDGDPISATIADFVTTQNEFGALKERASGGLWVPPAGVSPIWSDGPKVIASAQGHGLELNFLGNSGLIEIPQSINIEALIDIGESGAGADSAVGLGYSCSVECGCAGIFNDAGTWKRGIIFDGKAAPSLAAATACGTPGSAVDVITRMHTQAIGDGVNTGYSIHASGGGLTNGAGLWTALVAASGIGLGSNGPVQGIWFAVSLENGGTLEATLTRVRSSFWL